MFLLSASLVLSHVIGLSQWVRNWKGTTPLLEIIQMTCEKCWWLGTGRMSMLRLWTGQDTAERGKSRVFFLVVFSFLGVGWGRWFRMRSTV